MIKHPNSPFQKKRRLSQGKNLLERKSKGCAVLFSKALEGYKLHIEARHLSPNTIKDYFSTFTKFQQFLGEDYPLAEITPHQIEEFLASFVNVKNKTILNYYVGLSALWTWAVDEGLTDDHIRHYR